MTDGTHYYMHPDHPFSLLTVERYTSCRMLAFCRVEESPNPDWHGETEWVTAIELQPLLGPQVEQARKVCRDMRQN